MALGAEVGSAGGIVGVAAGVTIGATIGGISYLMARSQHDRQFEHDFAIMLRQMQAAQAAREQAAAQAAAALAAQAAQEARERAAYEARVAQEARDTRARTIAREQSAAEKVRTRNFSDKVQGADPSQLARAAREDFSDKMGRFSARQTAQTKPPQRTTAPVARTTTTPIQTAPQRTVAPVRAAPKSGTTKM